MSDNTSNLDKEQICLVVAVRNEEMTICDFVNKAINITDKFPEYKFRVLFIEDGSTDNTLTLLKSLKCENANVDAVSLYNPFGQGVALAWGISQSHADAVISIDVDGSHPVEIIKEMIEKFKDGYDVVQGIRIEYNRDSWYRQFASSIYFLVFSLFTGIDLQKQNVHFRFMNRRAYGIFVRNKPWWYSLRTNFSTRDKVRTCYIPFKAPERKAGKSKFNFRRLVAFAFTSFLTLTNPLRFCFLLIPFLVFAGLLYSINIWLGIISLFLLILLVTNYIRTRFIDYSILVKKNPIK
jgi:polyisoprenyl-phosphate glycosyltransferase